MTENNEYPDLFTATFGGPAEPTVSIVRGLLRTAPLLPLVRQEPISKRLLPALSRRLHMQRHDSHYFSEMSRKLALEVEVNSDMRAACAAKGGASQVVASLSDLDQRGLISTLIAIAGGTKALRKSVAVTGLAQILAAAERPEGAIVIAPHLGPNQLLMAPLLAEGHSIATFHNVNFSSGLIKAAAYLPFDHVATLNSIRVPSMESLILARIQMRSGHVLFYQPDAFDMISESAERIPCRLLGGDFIAYRSLYVFQRLTKAEVFVAYGRLQPHSARPFAVGYEKVADPPGDKVGFVQAVYRHLGDVLSRNIDQWRELGWWLDELARQRTELSRQP